jgi:ribose 5-phosphate isomerase A
MPPSVPAERTTGSEAGKRAAAVRAVEFVESGMRLGLGTGSTARHFLDVLADRLHAGSLTDIIGVATSTATTAHAHEVGVPLLTLDELPHLDLTVDGADEIDPALNLIKGHGGALLWEKMVACASDRLIIIADDSKLVDRLGSTVSLPVEVIPFGWSTHLPFFRELGARSELRLRQASPYTTDGGHYIVDCTFDDGIRDPAAIERRMKERTGVVETGLFVNRATAAVIGAATGARVLDPAHLS